MGQNRVLVILMVMIAICKPSSQDSSFLITRIKINNGTLESQHSVNIEGNGLDTEIEMELEDDLAPVLIICNGFILGDPRKDSVTAYSDTANTLVVITDKRKCVRRTRRDDGKERHQGLPDTECQELVETIVKAWDEFKESGAKNKYNKRGVIYVIKTKIEDLNRSVCLGSIRITGQGVDDILDMSCQNLDSAEVLFFPERVIVKGSNIVFANTYGQLTTVKDTSCEQKVFADYEKVTSVILESRMSFKYQEILEMECNQFRNIVNHYLDHPPTDIKITLLDYFIEKDVKYQEFFIEGNGIQEKVSIPETAAQNMQLLYIPGGFILGDWEGNMAFVYSDLIDTLVQITPDLCVQSTYVAGKLVRTIPTERSRHLKKMVNVWKELGKDKATNGFTVHRYSQEQNDQCDQDIMIEGQGVKTRLSVPCVSGKTMETIFTDRGVIVGHYKRNLKSLFSETEQETVIIERNICKWHDYTGESLRIDDLSDRECQRIKRKMDAAVERHKNDYLVALDKRNKEFRVSRKDFLDKNELCRQDIHLSGNGIVEVVKASCLTADSLDLLLMHEGFLLGDLRQDKMCVLGVTPGKLVVIKPKGRICKAILYNESGEASEKPINSKDCDEYITFVEATLNDKLNNRFWPITAPGRSTVDDRNKLFIEIVYINKKKEKKNYVQIKGNKINDSIKFKMSDDTTAFIMPNGFIVGDIKRNSQYIFSNNPNILAVIQKDKNVWKCRKWTYTGGKKSDYPMKEGECNNVKSAAEIFWDLHNSRKYNSAANFGGIKITKRMSSTDEMCEGSLTVQGDGMDQKETVDCPSLKATDVLFTRHGVVVGDPSRTSVAFLSEGARSLILLKNGRCFKRTYIPWNTTNSIKDYSFVSDSMSVEACTEVRKTINRILKAYTTR